MAKKWSCIRMKLHNLSFFHFIIIIIIIIIITGIPSVKLYRVTSSNCVEPTRNAAIVLWSVGMNMFKFKRKKTTLNYGTQKKSFRVETFLSL